MAAVLAAASYSREGFSPCLAISARRVRVPGGSMFHLEPGTICTYVHVHSDLMNICVRQNMHFFMTVVSNHCINKNDVGLSLIT